MTRKDLRAAAVFTCMMGVATIATAYDIVYEPTNNIAGMDGAASLAAADFDHDGVDDLVVAMIDGDRITIRFSTPVPTELDLVTGFDRACYVVVGDVDGDGWSDVVGGKRGTGDDDVRWWQNPAGPGAWTEHAVSGDLFDEARAVDVFDLDEDGDLDILVAGIDSGTGYVSWFRNMDGAGTSWVMLNVTSGFAGAHDVEVADINGDGLPDVVATAYDADVVRWFENDGDITGPGTWPGHDIVTGFDGALCVAAGDTDTDGDIDVVAGAWHADDVVVFRNSGDGTAWYPTVLADDLDGPYSVHLADVNHKRGPDVLVAARGADSVIWFERGFGATTYLDVVVDSAADGARSAIAVDLDVAAAAEFGDQVRVWENVSLHWRAGLANPFDVSDESSGVRDLAIADLDRDGHSDLVEARFNSTTAPDLVVWVYDSGVGFVASTVASDADGLERVLVADVDGDGDGDLMTASYFDDEVLWFENDGSASFTEHVAVPALDVVSIDVGDVDCDGDIDLVTAEWASAGVSWWENLSGDGTTWAEHPASLPVSLRRVRALDVVGDPAPDLVGDVNLPVDQLWVLENVGCGASWSGTQLGAMALTNAVAADFDRDGDRDLAITDQGSDTVAVWLQGSPWQRYDLSTSLVEAWAIDAGDLDNDGDPDLVVSGYGADTVSLWTNGGSGAGWTESPIASVDEPAAVVIGVVYHEYTRDVVVGAAGDGTVDVYNNTGGQYRFEGGPVAPPAAAPGERVTVLAFDTVSNGRSGDADIELHKLYVAAEDDAGGPLSDGALAALFDRIQLWHDVNGDRILQPGADVVLDDKVPLFYAVNEIRLNCGPGGVNPVIAGDGGAESYLVTLTLSPDAHLAGVDGFQLRLKKYLAAALATYVDDPLSYPEIEFGDPIPSGVTMVVLGPEIFADDFESGATGAWSSTVP